MENKSKFSQYVPIISIIFTGIFSASVLIVTTTWSISNLHTVNMVQDERLSRLEQNDLKYEGRFDKLDDKIDRVIQLILNQQKDKK